jgi:hypothetical protein
MVEALGNQDDDQVFARVAGEIPHLVRRWGIPVITPAFGLLIGTAMTLITPGPDEPDRLHCVVPAVLTRLRLTGLADDLLPTMAGVLTAACSEQNPWRWRQGMGPISNLEVLAWCYTAWLVSDLADEAVLHEHGAFARMLTATVTRC